MSRLQLLKTLAPGFLPLFVFIGAEALWGASVGLIVAVVFGVLELAVSYIREKKLDRFILLDTGLIVLLGSVSLLFRTDVFFRLKPALVELVFCLILGISVYSPLNIMMAMSRRYLKNLPVSEEQFKPMMQGMKVMFYLFLAHTALIVYAALAMSVRAWGFISGGLFYILFAVYLLLEWGRARWQRRRGRSGAADEEWFDIVDVEGHVRGKAPRRLCHSRRGLLHPVVHLHVINEGDRIFLQKRSDDKEIQPGKWDTAVGGHVRSGENIESALHREAEEELGLAGFKAVALARYVWESDIESELVYMFVTRTNQTPRINQAEISEGKFWKISKIREAREKKILTPNFEFEFKILLKQLFRDS